MRSVLTLAGIFLAYQFLSAVISIIVFAVSNVQQVLLQFFLAPSVPRTAAEVSVGQDGILFIWWGLPAALALFSFFIKRKDRANVWVFAGAGLLGLSFLANIVAPNLYLDRYVGLVGWLILAVTGGHTLRGIITGSRRMFLLVPLILLISFSAVIYPPMSPQYGYRSSDCSVDKLSGQSCNAGSKRVRWNRPLGNRGTLFFSISDVH